MVPITSAPLAGHETNSDFPAGDAVFLAALADVDRYTSPNSTAGGDDSIEREFDNRTSLIVDPPDGRVPLLTPEAAKRASAFAASRVIRLKRTDQNIYEVACHEGNYHTMQGVLAGARAAEKKD